jgi:hypothetical protein
MTRVFLGLGLAVALVCAMACSDDDKKKTNTNKICTNDNDCSDPFFRCELIITNATTGTCTKPCTSDDDCPDDHSCQEGVSIGLEPSCIATCGEGRSCPEGHSCATNPMGVPLCIPDAWNGA